MNQLAMAECFCWHCHVLREGCWPCHVLRGVLAMSCIEGGCWPCHEKGIRF